MLLGVPSSVSGSSSVSVPLATGLKLEGLSHPHMAISQTPDAQSLETFALSCRRVLGRGGAVATLGNKEPSHPSACEGWVGGLVPCPH